MIEKSILALVDYGRRKKFYFEEDYVYVMNQVLEVLGLDGISMDEIASKTPGEEQDLQRILPPILDWAAKTGVLEEDTPTHRDLLDAKLMGALLPRPSQVIETFEENYQISPPQATEAYYQFSIDGNYIRKDRTDRNLHWVTPTEYGDMEVTINLSKPEKDPKTIEKERNHPSSGYPKCLLCRENEGYAGRINHPARQNLRLIPLTLGGEPWFFQYSPYLYYNEHSIIFSKDHRPMKITRETFRRMLDFVDRFPHYFIGSNADLPLVGGSILSHDHYQGGRYEFPMEKAPAKKSFISLEHGDVMAYWVHWPLSIIRLEGKHKEALINCGEEIFQTWKTYRDEALDILPETDGTPHNTITPIVRKKEGVYQLDVVLRNNRCSRKYPEGIFHPHREVHGVKKENIGLIEVMGLAILPPRLKQEMKSMITLLEGGEISPEEKAAVKKHQDMLEDLKKEFEALLQEKPLDRKLLAKGVERAIGQRFTRGLEHSGVFKNNEEGQQGFSRFMNLLGWKEGVIDENTNE